MRIPAMGPFIARTSIALLAALAGVAIAGQVPTQQLIGKLKWRSVGPYFVAAAAP